MDRAKFYCSREHWRCHVRFKNQSRLLVRSPKSFRNSWWDFNGVRLLHAPTRNEITYIQTSRKTVAFDMVYAVLVYILKIVMFVCVERREKIHKWCFGMNISWNTNMWCWMEKNRIILKFGIYKDFWFN